MSEEKQTVADDMVVSMAYVLQIDGTEVDRADDDDPMQFLQGHGNIIPGLEKALYGMAVGDSKEVVVIPAEGYGERNPEDLDVLPREWLPEDYEPVVGDPLNLRDTESGEIFEVIISSVTDDQVEVDFNHPLAGETLHFAVKIVGLRPASAEELAHGHVHDGHHHH